MERLSIGIELTGINNKKTISNKERTEFNKLDCNYKLETYKTGAKIPIENLSVNKDVVRRSFKSVVKDLVNTNKELNKIGLTLEGMIFDAITLEVAMFDNEGQMIEIGCEKVKAFGGKTTVLGRNTEDVCNEINTFIKEASKIRIMPDNKLVKFVLVMNSQNAADFIIGKYFSGISLSVYEFACYELERRNIQTTDAICENRFYFYDDTINSVSKFEQLSDEDVCRDFIKKIYLLMEITIKEYVAGDKRLLSVSAMNESGLYLRLRNMKGGD